MTAYEKHIALYHEHNDKAKEHLHNAIVALRQNDNVQWHAEFDKHNAEHHLANKHFGIARAIATRHFNRMEARLPTAPLYTTVEN